MTVRHSGRAWAAFELVFQPWMRRRLAGVHIRGLDQATPLPDLPVLLVANHVSWWDGFLLREIHRRIRPGAAFHVVMAADQLRRNPILRRLGAVPLRRTVPGVRGLVRELEQVCRQGPAVLGYFPQGRIWPSHRRPLGFRRGGDWLAERLAPVVVLPVGLHLEPLNRSAPTAFVAVEPPILIWDEAPPGGVEAAVTRALDGIQELLNAHGESAPALWGAS